MMRSLQQIVAYQHRLNWVEVEEDEVCIVVDQEQINGNPLSDVQKVSKMVFKESGKDSLNQHQVQCSAQPDLAHLVAWFSVAVLQTRNL